MSAKRLHVRRSIEDQRRLIGGMHRRLGERCYQDEDQKSQSEKRTHRPRGLLLRRRVLIADDHSFVSWGLAKALSALEEVDIVGTVTNGIDAIVQIRKVRPDCAILDYNMPGANGMEVFFEAKRWSPQTRFVLLTGTALPETIRAFVEAGIHGVCLKDCSEDEILDVVRQVLQGKTAIGASAQRLLKATVETVAVTDRELAVLQAIARGHTNASAAEAARRQPQDD